MAIRDPAKKEQANACSLFIGVIGLDEQFSLVAQGFLAWSTTIVRQPSHNKPIFAPIFPFYMESAKLNISEGFFLFHPSFSFCRKNS